MSDDELRILQKRFAHLDYIAIAFLFGLAAFLLMCAIVHAQPSPKPTPSISSGLCVNNTTGAVRDRLSKNGVLQACHKGEQLVPIISLDSAPAQPVSTVQPTPAPGDPAPSPSATATVAPTPTPDPTATATPAPSQSNCTDCVLDANGNEVGPLIPLGNDASQDEAVLLTVNGVPLGLPVNDSGFINFQENGIAFLLWYPEANCAGQGYISVSASPPSGDQPLVELWGVQQGPWITGSTVYYAQPPWSVITALSFYSTTDPTVPPTSATCQNALQGTNLGTYLAGPPASASLSGFGTPPFSFQ